MATDLFPEAIQIVDQYHAKGTVSAAAQAIFGSESVFGKTMAKKWRDLLGDGGIDEIISDLTPYMNSVSQAVTCIKYLENNRHRMAYPLFHEQGICTSSGIVEAGCKLAIGTRLKRAGMHWTLAGANAIIALRCCRLSSRYENYWNRRLVA